MPSSVHGPKAEVTREHRGGRCYAPDFATHFWKLRSIVSLPRCHQASFVAKLERRRKKVRRKISTDDVQTAEEAPMAVSYYVALPFIRTEDGRSGLCGGGCIQSCSRSERWRVFRRGCTEEVRRCAGRFERAVTIVLLLRDNRDDRCWICRVVARSCSFRRSHRVLPRGRDSVAMGAIADTAEALETALLI
jgi:hypothetical protein